MNKVSSVRSSLGYMSFHLFMETAEEKVSGTVKGLDERDLTDERSLLIGRLMPSLIIQAPQIAWSTADQSCIELGKNSWRYTLVVSIDDPSWTLWSVEWPFRNQAGAHFSAEPDCGMLIAVETISAECRESARRIFTKGMDEFKVNLLKAQLEFDRYNAALPYLISFAIETALAGPPENEGDVF